MEAEPGDSDGGVDVLPNLRDDAVSGGGPRVHPPHQVGLVEPFSDGHWSEPNDVVRNQHRLGGGGGGGGSEERNEVVAVGGWAVEPPLQVWGQKTVHCVGVLWGYGFV